MSQAWRWMVTKTRDSKPFFFAFATVLGVVPGIIGYCVMSLTSAGNPELEAKLRKSAGPKTMRMGKANNEMLAEYLGELQRKEDTDDRYLAALRGEILTRKPRIQPVPQPGSGEVPPSSSEVKEKVK